MAWQGTLFAETDLIQPHFPSTRYQGSKQRFMDWIWSCVEPFPFETCLDAFGGTACFAYKAKLAGKSVTYNDIQPFNAVIGRALVENPGVKLAEEDIESVLDFSRAGDAPRFIYETFHDIYYTDEENLWLDRVVFNIRRMSNPYKRDMAYFALFQACLAKRPYNLFHRKNLYVRLQDVKRSFGNKTTWDRPFPDHFRKFAAEANDASFQGFKTCRAIGGDAMDVPPGADLVYVDPPYVNKNGQGVDYGSFYHFLNGLVVYDRWEEQIDYGSAHRKMRTIPSPWSDSTHVFEAFEKLFLHFRSSVLAVSYRDDGIPSIEDICTLLRKTHREVRVHTSKAIKYALSRNPSFEVLITALP